MGAGCLFVDSCLVFGRSSGKVAKLGGLHSNWKQRAAQVPSQLQQPPTTTAPPLVKSRTGRQDQVPKRVDDGEDQEVAEVDGGEMAADEDNEFLEAVRTRKNKQAIGAAKKYHKGGTKGVRLT